MMKMRQKKQKRGWGEERMGRQKRQKRRKWKTREAQVAQKALRMTEE